MKKVFVLSVILFALISCGNIKEKAKDGINKSGETVGKSATEFFEGVSEGIDKSLQCEISLSENLQNQGIRTGKYAIENSHESGSKNLLIIYLIFDKNFNSSITAKAFDKNRVEIGRSKLEISNKAENAGYYDFAFDKRTVIEAKSKIILE